jgi:hypothetical protein
VSDLEQRRGPGALAIAPGLARALARLRAAAGVTGAPELAIDELRNVELAVGVRFEDDLLAVFAAAAPPLSTVHQMALARVVALTGALREHRVRGDLVGVGRADSTTFLCVDLRSGRSPSGTTELVLHDVESGRPHAILSLAAWIEERAAGCPDTDAPFAPRVAPAMTESYNAASARRVRHRVFGEGRVLSEHGDGPTRKVKADFPRAGLKLLQARFLEFLDD